MDDGGGEEKLTSSRLERYQNTFYGPVRFRFGTLQTHYGMFFGGHVKKNRGEACAPKERCQECHPKRQLNRETID